MGRSLIELVEEFKRLERKRQLLGEKMPLADAERLAELKTILSQKLHGSGPADRRKELRVPVNYRVRFRSGEVFVNNYIHNLSSGGVFVSTPTPLPLDTPVKLLLIFDEQKKEIEVEGKVVWESTQKSSMSDITKPGMGVKFTKVSPEAKAFIEEIIHSVLTEQAKRVDEENNRSPKKKK
jgi:uncharacterized protein (TIGR02266 family)